MTDSSVFFRWNEPHAFRRARRIKANEWLRYWQLVSGIAATTGLCLIIWGFANGGPNVNPAQERIMIVGILLNSGIICFLPWLQEIIPFSVIVRRDSLMRVFDRYVYTFEWVERFGIHFGHVHYYEVREFSDYRMLVFVLRDKRRLWFGVPLEFNLERLEQYFARKKMQRGPLSE